MSISPGFAEIRAERIFNLVPLPPTCASRPESVCGMTTTITSGNTVHTYPVAKVMISMPDNLLDRLDARARANRETRSGFLRRLAERELEWSQPAQRDEVEALLRSLRSRGARGRGPVDPRRPRIALTMLLVDAGVWVASPTPSTATTILPSALVSDVEPSARGLGPDALRGGECRWVCKGRPDAARDLTPLDPEAMPRGHLVDRRRRSDRFRAGTRGRAPSYRLRRGLCRRRPQAWTGPWSAPTSRTSSRRAWPWPRRRRLPLRQMSVLEQVQADVRTAMKAGERERAAALRMIVDSLQQDAKLGNGDEVAVLQRERKKRLEAAEAYARGGPGRAGGRRALRGRADRGLSAGAAVRRGAGRACRGGDRRDRRHRAETDGAGDVGADAEARRGADGKRVSAAVREKLGS